MAKFRAMIDMRMSKVGGIRATVNSSSGALERVGDTYEVYTYRGHPPRGSS